MSTAKKQTGLTIERKGNAFVCSWKKGETYTKQLFEYKLNKGKWISVDIGKNAKQKSIKDVLNNYVPYTSAILSTFSFRVKADAKGDSKSAWQDKTFTLYAPPKPTLNVTPHESSDNVTTFNWSVTEAANQPIVNVEYQTQLTTGNDAPNWSNASVAKPLTDSVTFTEDSATLQNQSCTRWVRVRARGAGGYSDWNVQKRVYATPNAATNVKTDVNVQDGGMQISVNWDQQADDANPVGQTEEQYVIAVPGAGMSAPSSGWEKLSEIAGAGGASSGFVSELLDDDECLFVRVATTHLLKTVTSAPVIAQYGKLKNPSITTVTKNDSTYRATVTVSSATAVPGAFTVIQYRTASQPGEILTVGVIPNGSTSATVQCPNWSEESAVEFGIYSAVGTYEAKTRSDGVGSYTVSALMKSDSIWQGGTVPQAPTGLTVDVTDVEGTVRVTWNWTWSDAESAVISWADHPDAWESTDPPEEFELSNIHAGAWNVAGLELGKRWYFRVKLVKGLGDDAVSGSWSEMVDIDLSSAPNIPVLSLSQRVVTFDDSFAAYWTYESNDSTGQIYAEVCEATISGGTITYGDVIATSETSQNVTIYVEGLWSSAATHYLCARVVSASGRESAWSAPVSIMVVEPIEAEITQTSLVSESVTVDGVTFTQNTLKALPLTVTITGAGNGGITSLAIARTEAYHVDRPDETDFNGYADETVFVLNQTGEGQITVSVDDAEHFIGRLDDGALYKLIATVKDNYGQSDTVELDFVVDWTHKALKPWGTVVLDGTVAIIEPFATGYANGDTCDIYRLSADRPELVYSGLSFGTKVVDPYPAIGEYGGYRFVYKTYNNDYITADNEIAWFDIDIGLNVVYNLIDFDENQIEFLYDVEHSNEWEKDFKETKYLGGSVVGDWNKAVSRTASLSGSVVTIKDQDTMRLFRRLSDHTGVCHLRTVDGSSFDCDIQVSEDRRYDRETIRGTYNLSVTRVDPEEPAGALYDVWVK